MNQEGDDRTDDEKACDSAHEALPIDASIPFHHFRIGFDAGLAYARRVQKRASACTCDQPDNERVSGYNPHCPRHGLDP